MKSKSKPLCIALALASTLLVGVAQVTVRQAQASSAACPNTHCIGTDLCGRVTNYSCDLSNPNSCTVNGCVIPK